MSNKTSVGHTPSIIAISNNSVKIKNYGIPKENITLYCLLSESQTPFRDGCI